MYYIYFMKHTHTLILLLTLQTVLSFSSSGKNYGAELSSYISESISQFDMVPVDRKKILETLTDQIQELKNDGIRINLTFICTHNSRRSHMSQIWAKVAADFYDIENIDTYSGGTESTAFNSRAVEAMRRAGFKIKKTTHSKNPIYHTHFSSISAPITNFSKMYDTAPNPNEGFIAVMTCSDADINCPAIFGCIARIPIPYEDPKISDGTKHEISSYDERCRQISRELLYVFSRID